MLWNLQFCRPLTLKSSCVRVMVSVITYLEGLLYLLWPWWGWDECCTTHLSLKKMFSEKKKKFKNLYSKFVYSRINWIKMVNYCSRARKSKPPPNVWAFESVRGKSGLCESLTLCNSLTVMVTRSKSQILNLNRLKYPISKTKHFFNKSFTYKEILLVALIDNGSKIQTHA